MSEVRAEQPDRLFRLADETILAYNYLEPTLGEQLLEVLRMANALEKLIEDTLVRGQEEGRAEGEMVGFRKAVRHAIERRFGQVPPALDARLATADEPTLERLLDRLPSTTQPEDLLAP
jgi:hypothetical protein